MILSPIEQSIKQKIEAVGTPLKDWDININYGIKTGYNDAFIITTDKRNEILDNCETEDERKRTEELIRPLLRGRDIKRYGYEWAGLWLINSHNGIKDRLHRIDIKEYPAVKAHLDLYLKQLEKRTDKGDTPYNLRKCAYLEDFFVPKIVWKIIGSRLAFTIDTKGYYINNACYLMTGEHLKYILAFLNSSPLIWYSEITNKNKTGVGDAQVGAQNILLFPIPKVEATLYDKITCIVEYLLTDSKETRIKELETIISGIFKFTKAERAYLEQLNL